MTNSEEKGSTATSLKDTLVRYATLLIEDTRLSVAEKLTRMMAAIALAAMLTILLTVALVFMSIAAGFALAEVMPPLWAFLIVGGIYFVMMIVLILCRESLIVNPIARFISRLILPAPKKAIHDNAQSTPIS